MLGGEMKEPEEFAFLGVEKESIYAIKYSRMLEVWKKRIDLRKD